MTLIKVSYEFLNIFWIASNILHNCFSHFRIQYFQSVHIQEVFRLTNKLVKTRTYTFSPEHVAHLQKRIYVLQKDDDCIQNKVSICKTIVLQLIAGNICKKIFVLILVELCFLLLDVFDLFSDLFERWSSLYKKKSWSCWLFFSKFSTKSFGCKIGYVTFSIISTNHWSNIACVIFSQ